MGAPARSGEPSRSPPQPGSSGTIRGEWSSASSDALSIVSTGRARGRRGHSCRTPSGSWTSSATKERDRCDHGARGPAARVSALRWRPRIGTSYGEPDPGDAVLPESQDGRSGYSGSVNPTGGGSGSGTPSVLLGRGARGGGPLTRHEPGEAVAPQHRLVTPPGARPRTRGPGGVPSLHCAPRGRRSTTLFPTARRLGKRRSALGKLSGAPGHPTVGGT